MGAKIEGLEQLQANIARMARKTVPKAVAQSINAVAKQALKQATKTVSKEVKAPLKLIRPRAKLTHKATAMNPSATLRVNRSNLPLIRLLEDPRKKVLVKRGAIRIGQHNVKRGFVQILKNGRQQVMQRQGKGRYPIDVVKIPLSAPLTEAFHKELQDYQGKIQVELTKNLTKAFNR